MIKLKSNQNLKKNCKFCSTVGHSMLGCRKYNNHTVRIDRCRELKLCSLCTSSKHVKERCPGNLQYKCNICNSNHHVTAMFSKFNASKTDVTDASNKQ